MVVPGQGGCGGAQPVFLRGIQEGWPASAEEAGRGDRTALLLPHCQKLWGCRGVSNIVGTFKSLLIP